MAGQPNKQKLWGGRFAGKTDPLYVPFIDIERRTSKLNRSPSMDAFNQSLKYDQRMHAADIRGSIAYAKALYSAGVLTKEEETKITQGLATVGEEWKAGVVRVISEIPFTQHHSEAMRSFSLRRVTKTYIPLMNDD
jgi:argininosuccinate lyase